MDLDIQIYGVFPPASLVLWLSLLLVWILYRLSKLITSIPFGSG